jgi:hypothetical protein
MAPDTTEVFTDSLGVFSLRVDDGAPLFVEVGQYGYQSQLSKKALSVGLPSRLRSRRTWFRHTTSDRGRPR